jgi:non-canonical (house-cleaning) NTP pyrophosphatase
MHVPHTKTDFMNICVCVIYDGEEYHIGISSAFEYPTKVTELVFKEGLDVNQAFYRAGLTKNPKIGSSEGAIGVLTHGRLTRKEHIKQGIAMALIHLENAQLY